MKKLFLAILMGVFVATAFAADELSLGSRVKDRLTKTDLTQAYVLRYDSAGNVLDSIRCNQGLAWRGYNEIDTLSYFSFTVPRVDSTYIFDVICPGYKDETITFEVKNVGKRELSREIPLIYMDRAPRQLNEVTVTSSKIKFYNKGDTVVYNADAFQLAEGSMLDALISQLPGVELNADGQIKVNGQFVESLVLNGKPFLDGNNNLMLENIGAYTVQNIQVYEGQSKESQVMGDRTAQKVLTMDVRLKKEYNMGWLINAQGGYGTSDRYTGRLFANWFNTTTRVTLLANVNNLNDNRQPGRNDTWTPEQMPSGKKEYRMASLSYNYESPDDKTYSSGSISFSQRINNYRSSTSRINFLPGGDTYENSFGDSRSTKTQLTLRDFSATRIGNFNLGASIHGVYERNKDESNSLSGSFRSEQADITTEILDALYSNGSQELLNSVINRSKTRSDGWRRHLFGNFSPSIAYNIPRTEDRIRLEMEVSYTADKEELWRDYDINYGADPVPAARRRQYFDNSPNHELDIKGNLGYSTYMKGTSLRLSYIYGFNDKVKDSYMYALDRLGDMGVFGVVPAGYLAALDPANSYASKTFTNTHGINVNCYRVQSFPEQKSMLTAFLYGNLDFVHRKFDYWRNNTSYRLSTQNTTLNLPSLWSCAVEYSFAGSGEGRDTRYKHSIKYSYRINSDLPQLEDMVDVVNDADPLNIYYGNSALKPQTRHRHLVHWAFNPSAVSLNNILYLGFYHTTNTLTRGYVYNTDTGVRINRMYNVNGDHTYAITNELKWQFGKTKQFTLSSETDANFNRSADMIGINLDEPELFRVNNRSLSENLRLSWSIAGQTLSLRCDYTNRHATSDQVGFNTLDANHVNYGFSGVFKLPAGFGASTDFMCYTRRGYGSSNLDTTDPIWNARLTYCPPRHSRWVFMVDGFDLLHRLSNVNYAVTATGRTVSYTNTLPRYVLFSVQYRLSIQPKKR